MKIYHHLETRDDESVSSFLVYNDDSVIKRCIVLEKHLIVWSFARYASTRDILNTFIGLL